MLTCAKCGSSVALPADPRELSTSCAKCGSGVDLSSMRTLVDTATPPAAAADDAIPQGKLLAGYRVEKVLGRGGMAVVYKATQLSLSRPVAIKTLPRNLAASPAFVSRFNREAGALAALNHPNIINIIDRGVDGEIYYFVMEFVDGEDLQARMKRERIPSNEAVSILQQACAALEYAHKRGVIHRDIKPGNIMIDRNGTVKVTDFGIAHLAGGAETTLGLTMAGAQMGTLNYMAPEQRTDAASVDARADIYALGVVLYEMLTGQLPLGAFDPPSGDPKLAAVVMRALRQDPKARFASAQEMAAALGAPAAPVATHEAPRVETPTVAPCPFCKAENRADAKFCVGCGKTLIESCPKCRKSMKAQSRFCDACGTNVTEFLTQVKEDLQTKLTQADRLGKEGRLADALTELETILSTDSADLKELRAKAKERKERLVTLKEKQDAAFKKGQELYDRKEFEQAIEAWSKLPSVLTYVQEAVAEAKKKIEARQAAIRAAEAAQSQGKFDEALREWQRAVDLSPNADAFRPKMEQARHGRFVEVSRKAAEAAARRDLNEAAACWAEALKCKPDDPTAKAELAKIELQKRIAEREALISRGDQAAAGNRHREAIECWQKAVALLVPDNPALRADLERKIQASRTTQGANTQKLVLFGAIGGGALLFVIVLIVILVAVFSDDNGKGGGGSSSSFKPVPGTSTPEELYTTGCGLMESGNYAKLYELQSARIKQRKSAAVFAQECQQTMLILNGAGARPSTWQRGQVNITGDSATVGWSFPVYYYGQYAGHQASDKPFHMVKESGGWRYDDD